MTVNLTPNAIEMICNGEFQGDEVKPVVQVSDVKLLSAGQQNSSERYRMILSDGVHLQQGMLATQLNSLVHEGKLQKGSIVQLSQFVSQMIQNRKIIIIIGLNVILEKCDPIGEPKTYVQGGGTATGVPQARPSMPVQSSMDQPGNRQSYGAASLSNGPPPGPNINGRAPMQHPKADSGVSAQPYGSSFPSNSDSGRYGTTAGPPAYPKAEPGGPLAGNYSDQNRSFQNPKVEGGSRPPLNSYSRPVQPTYQQPPPMYANRGPVAKNEAPARIIPIAALNPYQGRWTIKARVTSKKELRRFNGARGEGKVFSFELLDSDGGEIQVTCFNAAADQFYDQIEAGKVYMISRGNLKPASKTFNRLQNDYEIHLESTSSVQPCFEDDSTIPRQQFHFRPISDIESMAKDTFVDVIGVVSSINLTGTILKKDGTETMKRTLHLKDMSGRSVELTMWGNLCNAEGQQLQNICDSGIFPVLALKGGRVSEFNGKTVGTVFSTQLFIDPDFPEARRLKEWFDMEGKNTPAVSISKDSTGMGKVDVRKTISQIKDERLGTSEKPDYIMVKATIAFIKLDSFCYTACPLMIGDRQCSKKVINNGDGQWRCDRCDRSVDECDYRYNLSCQIQDHTGVTWVTAFQEAAEVILGVSAKELYFLKYEEQDDDKFTDITRKALFTPYMFKLRVKEETYNDEQRVKSNVSTAEKLNFSSEARYLLEMMDKLSTEGPGADPGQAGSIVNSSMNNVGYQNMGMKQASPSVMSSMGSSNTGKNFSAPANQVGQYGNQYSGGKEPAMMGTGVLLCCNSCGGTGHNAKNCPSVMSKPQVQPMGGFVNRGSSAGLGISGGGGGGGGECYKCHQIGHWARDCPGSNNIESSGGGGGGYGGGGGGYGSGGGGGGGGGECYKCHQSGHWARDCPGSNTVSSGYGSGGGGGGGECYKCHQSGHWARDCPGSNTVSSGYGSGGVTGGYGGVSNQRVGGF